MEKNSESRLILVTLNSLESAFHTAKILLSEKIAHYCSVVPQVHSFFSWNDSIVEKNEAILFIRTECDQVNELQERIIQINKDVPAEMLSLKVEICPIDVLNVFNI